MVSEHQLEIKIPISRPNFPTSFQPDRNLNRRSLHTLERVDPGALNVVSGFSVTGQTRIPLLNNEELKGGLMIRIRLESREGWYERRINIASSVQHVPTLVGPSSFIPVM